MSFITVICARTEEFISTGIEINAEEFRSFPPTVFRTRCPACGSEHAWSKGRAWLTERSDRLVRPALQEATWLALTQPDHAEARSIDEFAYVWSVNKSQTVVVRSTGFGWASAQVEGSPTPYVFVPAPPTTPYEEVRKGKPGQSRHAPDRP